jgi:hypothetical protein
MDKICGTCRHWTEHAPGSEFGCCRAHAPTIAMAQVSQPDSKHANQITGTDQPIPEYGVWVVTPRTQTWCGDGAFAPP